MAETDENRKNSGTIYLDDFTAHYLDIEIEDNEKSQPPSRWNLEQNHPNPFNMSTKIAFALPHPASVKLEIYNIRGEKIDTILNQNFSPGRHEIDFNASALSSGVYLYQLDGGVFKQIKKMIVLK